MSTADEVMPAFPVELENGAYGFFGYQGYCVDVSIRQDSATMLQECIDRGYMDKSTVTIDNMNMRRYAQYRKATQCDALLARLGWPEAA